jgi:hypothetical protein
MNAPEMNFRPKGLYIGGEWVLEESLDELLSYTRVKNINMRW